MSSILIHTTSVSMAAGSDCESMESLCTSGAVTNFHQTTRMPNQFTNIRHNIPYPDHNYGQPPPMTPPDSNSPAPDDIDTGNEDEENDGVTRCICGYDHDDGYMICCDQCSVWQHIECMGISSSAVPENYLCEQCQPRELDKDHAKIIQARKREEMSDDDDDDEDCESDGDKDVQSYTAVSNTPTRITLTAKITQQKRKRTRSKSKFEDHKKKVRRKKHQRQKTTETFVPAVDEETNEPWEVSSNYGNIDRYEEIKENVYAKELDEIDLNWKENDLGASAVDINEQLCKVVEVQRHRKGIVTTEDMNKNQFIIEFKGKLVLQQKFESENPFFTRCHPYVLYYSKLDHLGLCVDARKQGNDARFVRRSCSPTAQIKHFINKGKVHLGIYSLYPLPKGSEITVAFEFDIDEYECYLECACAQDTCIVAKYNTKYQGCQTETSANRRFRARANDDSNSSHQAKMSPLRSVGSHSNQGDSDSDVENNPERPLSQPGSRRKKMTREERKLEAYLKQIEKMEKKEKRNKDKEHHKQVHRTSSDDTPVEGKLPKYSVSKRQGSKRRLHTGTPANQKSKRARLSSGSSEPLSPEEHSSAASTPTTPKITSSIPEEEGSNTLCTSPNESFKFPKNNARVSGDEEFKENPVKPVKQESGDQSSVSSPSSPSIIEGDMEIPHVLSAASSTPDLTLDDTTNDASNVSTPKTIDIPSAGPDITSLKKQLVEISTTMNIEMDSPSPCSSTSGSPTCAASVMNSCNAPVTSKDTDASSQTCPRQNPAPAPGSPVASVIYGTKLTRSNPLYGSLKKRWLLQFLYGQNIVNDHVPNGFKSKVNGTSMCATFRRKPQQRIQTVDVLPLKKRHLKRYRDSMEEATRSAQEKLFHDETTTPVKQSISANRGLLMYSPITPENNFSRETIIHSGQTVSERMEHILANEQLICTRPKPLKLNFDKPSMLKLSDSQSSSGQNECLLQSSELGTALRIDTSSVTLTADNTSQCRPSDPRLVVTSPEGMQLVSPSNIREVVVPGTPASHMGSIHQSVIAMAHSSIDSSSGTPGKKKVSLLEYRNRSRQRLSSDSPKSSTCTSHSPVSPSSTSLVTSVSFPLSTSAPIKSSLSSSMPNLSAPTKYSSKKETRSASDSNGPLFEPVSPDDEMRAGLGEKLVKHTSVTLLGTPPKRDTLFSQDIERKREYQRRHEMISKKEEGKERLGAFIHEALTKDAKLKDMNSPASTGSSVDSPAPPPPPPPPELSVTQGDAMEIEEDETNVGSGKIYVNTPLVSSAAHQHRVSTPVQPQTHAQPQSQRQLQPLPQVQVHNQLPPPQSQLSPQPRASLLGAYPGQQPQQRPVISAQATTEYGIAHNIQASRALQGARPLFHQQAQPYLITSPPGSNPSLVRFPYQSSSGQATGFFPQ